LGGCRRVARGSGADFGVRQTVAPPARARGIRVSVLTSSANTKTRAAFWGSMAKIYLPAALADSPD